MKNKKILLAGLIALLSGCLESEPEPKASDLPEVNSENCQISAIKKITPLEARQEFAAKCARRGSDVQLSEPIKPIKW